MITSYIPYGNAFDVSLEQAQDALKNPNCRKSVVAVLKNGGDLPRAFGRLETIAPVKKGEVVSWKDFLARSKELAQNAGKKVLGQEAYDFYKKRENWHLMPSADSGINVVFFVEAQFDSGGLLRVRCLCRDGSEWGEGCKWLSYEFFDDSFAAISQN